MTEKELLYMEDAINHESNLVELCNITINNLEDKDLQSFMKSELKKHEALKEKLMNVMEDLANE
ncbi:MAG: hypothetical protein NC483_02100 [Ruminococcus sp.]|nr:hypothetical protein [Ruminococcus sp.]